MEEKKMRYNNRFRCYNTGETTMNERNVRKDRTLQRRGGLVAFRRDRDGAS